jgi:protein-S-isoprenylcysteine O-methyltransferase Ste14
MRSVAGDRHQALSVPAGLTACVAGLGAVAAGMGAFSVARQVTGTDPGDLKDGGLYRYSRNPQYVGFVLAGAGAAVARRSVPAAALTAGYAAICAWWVRVEERSLNRTFGHDYDRYQRRTPRWGVTPATERDPCGR